MPSERTIDGRSFAPQLRGEKGQPREWAYVQLGQERYVRSLGWKLTGAGQFFDMKDAPFKDVLVAADTTDPEARAARVTLQAALDRLKQEESAAPPPKKKKKKVE